MAGGLGNVLTTFFRLVSEGADTVRVLELESQGTNGATTKLYIGDRDPTGTITAEPGEFYARIDGVNSTLYIHIGAVANNTDWFSMLSGTGDVFGPGSSDDEAVARFDLATGKVLQNSPVKISDSGAFRDWTDAVISPAAIAAQIDNYNPTDWVNADLVLLSLTGDQNATGFAAVDGTPGVPSKILVNTSDADTLTLLHDDLTSTAANRVLLPGERNFRLRPLESAVLTYDVAAARWRLVAHARDPELHVTIFNELTVDPVSSTNNDYSPTDWSTLDTLVVNNPEGDVTFTGFDATVVQHRKTIVNTSTAGIVLITHEDAGSSAANRVLCPGGYDIVLNEGESCILQYSVGDSRWRVIALSETQLITTIHPTALAAQANDYAPTDWAISDLIQITLTGAQTITGFEALAARNRKTIRNNDSVDNLTLSHQNVSSAAANRIITPTGGDIVLPPGHSVVIEYDTSGVQSRWHVVSSTHGLTRAYGESEGDSTITGTTAFQQKLRVSLPSTAPAGTYRIVWSYTWYHNATNSNFQGRIQIDDTTTIWAHEDEPSDSAITQRRSAGGFREVTLTAGVHDIDVDFATSSSADTSGIQQTRLSVEYVP